MSNGRTAPLIRVENLWHTYMLGTPFERVALRGVTLEVYAGEVLGVIGQTGSGKSTLLQYLNGLFRPVRGRVIVGDRDLGSRETDVQSVRRMVGVLFQEPEDQVFERLVGDDVAYGPRQFGLRPGEVRERVRWAMEAVGLSFEAFKDRYTFTLSGGEMRKVALAGVLALRPRVLVLDEPTSGLDPRSRMEVRGRIQDLRGREDLTLVLASHDMDEIAHLSDRLVVLHEGTVVASGPPREIFRESARLEALGLAVPEPTQVMQRLSAMGFPVPRDVLTVEEAGEALTPLLRVAS